MSIWGILSPAERLGYLDELRAQGLFPAAGTNIYSASEPVIFDVSLSKPVEGVFTSVPTAQRTTEFINPDGSGYLAGDLRVPITNPGFDHTLGYIILAIAAGALILSTK